MRQEEKGKDPVLRRNRQRKENEVVGGRFIINEGCGFTTVFIASFCHLGFFQDNYTVFAKQC